MPGREELWALVWLDRQRARRARAMQYELLGALLWCLGEGTWPPATEREILQTYWKAKQRRHYLPCELLRTKQQVAYGLSLAQPLFVSSDRAPYLVIYCINDRRQKYSKWAGHVHYCDNCCFIEARAAEHCTEPWPWAHRWLQVEHRSRFTFQDKQEHILQQEYFLTQPSV